jgi:hypothetical protein
MGVFGGRRKFLNGTLHSLPPVAHTLDLSYNQFSGTIPEALFTKGLKGDAIKAFLASPPGTSISQFEPRLRDDDLHERLEEDVKYDETQSD